MESTFRFGCFMRSQAASRAASFDSNVASQINGGVVFPFVVYSFHGMEGAPLWQSIAYTGPTRTVLMGAMSGLNLDRSGLI